LNLASLPVVAMYFPQEEMLREVRVEEGWVSIRTTGLEPVFGVHMVTSPVECPTPTTPF